jgi:hypothetical protein
MNIRHTATAALCARSLATQSFRSIVALNVQLPALGAARNGFVAGSQAVSTPSSGKLSSNSRTTLRRPASSVPSATRVDPTATTHPWPRRWQICTRVPGRRPSANSRRAMRGLRVNLAMRATAPSGRFPIGSSLRDSSGDGAFEMGMNLDRSLTGSGLSRASSATDALSGPRRYCAL